MTRRNHVAARGLAAVEHRANNRSGAIRSVASALARFSWRSTAGEAGARGPEAAVIAISRFPLNSSAEPNPAAHSRPWIGLEPGMSDRGLVRSPRSQRARRWSPGASAQAPARAPACSRRRSPRRATTAADEGVVGEPPDGEGARSTVPPVEVPEGSPRAVGVQGRLRRHGRAAVASRSRKAQPPGRPLSGSR